MGFIPARVPDDSCVTGCPGKGKRQATFNLNQPVFPPAGLRDRLRARRRHATLLLCFCRSNRSRSILCMGLAFLPNASMGSIPARVQDAPCVSGCPGKERRQATSNRNQPVYPPAGLRALLRARRRHATLLLCFCSSSLSRSLLCSGLALLPNASCIACCNHVLGMASTWKAFMPVSSDQQHLAACLHSDHVHSCHPCSSSKAVQSSQPVWPRVLECCNNGSNSLVLHSMCM